MTQSFESLLVLHSETVRAAMAQMDRNAEQILLVTRPSGVLYGTLTDGDVRRHILREGSLQVPVGSICNTHPRSTHLGYLVSDIKREMLALHIKHVPVIDARGRILEVLRWEELFGEQGEPPPPRLAVPVVIMAGGRGTRLDPFTRILPKPLIPLEDRPVVQVIMDEFLKYGCDRFMMTVNYKAPMIESYFNSEELRNRYTIEFIHEKEATGTAGSLKALAKKLRGDFFLTNCDILIRADYDRILRFHREQANTLTIVASMQQMRVPYGVIELQSSGKLKQIVEKPEYDFLANAGLYVLGDRISRYFPTGSRFDMTDLINQVLRKRGEVGIYPVSQGAWSDVGQWVDYFRAAVTNRLGRES